MFEIQPLSVGGLGETLDRLLERESGEFHVVRVGLAEPEPVRFPQMAHALGIESQQARADHIRRKRMSALVDIKL